MSVYIFRHTTVIGVYIAMFIKYVYFVLYLPIPLMVLSQRFLIYCFTVLPATIFPSCDGTFSDPVSTVLTSFTGQSNIRKLGHSMYFFVCY